jgi:hypothetical protein
MTDSEKAQIRLDCLIHAIGLKQNPVTTKMYMGKDVIEIAKELETFIIG